MTDHHVSLRTVDLDNCDKEPIHIPGSVQPHGSLIALDLDGRLTHASRNAAAFFSGLPALGLGHADAGPWRDPSLREATDGMLEDASAERDVPPLATQLSAGGLQFDVVLHARAGRVLLEFERRSPGDELASFALFAHRSMSRLKGRGDIESMLAEAVTAVRRLTGFDRVMAYRFHLDDSGEIVAEAKADALETYRGRRFPASDIPVQARRLYVLNTLRLIADVHDTQVPIDAFDRTEAPLDLSYSILRSVSPIHVEYLKNINVAASMSVSIVVDGRLWGLIACHHRTAHRVPYAVRMACDVLASVVSGSVQLLIERRTATRRAAASDLRASLVELNTQGERPPMLGPSRAAIGRVIEHDGMIFAHGSDQRQEGLDAVAALELLQWLEPQSGDLIALNELTSLPDVLRARLSPLGGLLALRHDRVNKGWMVLLRNEQTSTVTWSGAPDKVSRIGPLGARLTPDGSLAEWQQDVLGSAAPWEALDLSLAGQVLNEVTRATALRAAEMDQARTHLLAILGHDLRGPLQSISMAALLIERGRDQMVFARRISAASSRMGRLIGQVLDMSRLHGGLGLGLTLLGADLVELVNELVEESRLAYPNAAIETTLPAQLMVEMDRDRIAQVVSNLLSNARQHGTHGEPTMVSLVSSEDRAILQIRNVAPPLPVSIVSSLFDPLKRGSLANQNNPHGLGLGLYIAHEALKGHRGSIVYSHENAFVVFTVELPWVQAAEPAVQHEVCAV